MNYHLYAYLLKVEAIFYSLDYSVMVAFRNGVSCCFFFERTFFTYEVILNLWSGNDSKFKCLNTKYSFSKGATLSSIKF